MTRASGIVSDEDVAAGFFSGVRKLCRPLALFHDLGFFALNVERGVLPRHIEHGDAPVFADAAALAVGELEHLALLNGPAVLLRNLLRDVGFPASAAPERLERLVDGAAIGDL